MCTSDRTFSLPRFSSLPIQNSTYSKCKQRLHAEHSRRYKNREADLQVQYIESGYPISPYVTPLTPHWLIPSAAEGLSPSSYAQNTAWVHFMVCVTRLSINIPQWTFHAKVCTVCKQYNIILIINVLTIISLMCDVSLAAWLWVGTPVRMTTPMSGSSLTSLKHRDSSASVARLKVWPVQLASV